MRMQSIVRVPCIDLRTLVGMDAVSNQKARAAMFYAESWALVHMLSLDGRYSGHLRQFFDALQSADSAHAFEAAYGKSVARVEGDLRAYIHGPTLNTAVFDLKLDAPRGQPESSPNANLSARLALAELLSNERRAVGQAETAYRTLAREYENSAEVEEAWGEFYSRERRYPEAIRHFSRAESLGGGSPSMYLEYARVLGRSNHTTEAIAALRKCLQLDAALDEAHFELAVALVRGGQDRDAVSEFHRIRKLGPEYAYRYFYYLAVAHGRLGDTEQSRRLIEKARPETRNPEERAALDRLLHSLGAQ
jgi:tetratricopeptide (TPR) repeat protein